MSEINRYKAVKILTEVGNNISYTPHGPDVVMAADFDRATAERDAALAELSEIKESLAYRGSLLCRIEGQRDALQQLLTAADEREAVLERVEARYRWLQKATPYRFKKIQDASVTDGGDVLYFHSDRFDAAVDAALKPAEGGGDEG